MPAKQDTSDVVERAIRWVAAVTAHRKRNKTFGKVNFDVVDIPGRPREVHLREETTFKEGTDPLKDAIIWLEKQRQARIIEGVPGSIGLESNQKDGLTTWARVVEITIISDQIS